MASYEDQVRQATEQQLQSQCPISDDIDAEMGILGRVKKVTDKIKKVTRPTGKVIVGGINKVQKFFRPRKGFGQENSVHPTSSV